MSLHSQYQDTLDYMFSKLPMFQRVGTIAYKKDLSNISKLCRFLNDPQNQFKSIHIAGTNGKGSVSHMLAAVFQKQGFKTGLYVSPHYKDYRERIKINGRYISKRFVVNFIEKLKPLIEEINPSFFEINVAMAFEYFYQQKIDIAIIETGLGGRLDSTNIIEPLLSIITNISFDHTNLLGDTLPLIAYEKAGIIKSGVPVVIGERQNDVQDVFDNKAKQQNASISFASDHFEVVEKRTDLHFSYYEIVKNGKVLVESVPFNLHGSFQAKNIATVLEAIEIYNTQITKINGSEIPLFSFLEAGRELKKLTKFMGRWQILSESPLILCDSGHNEAGIKFVVEQLNMLKYDLHIVLGVVNDKAIDKMLKLLPTNAIYYFCKANIPRGLDAGILRLQAKEIGLLGKSYSSVKNALKAAKRKASKNDAIFIGGSTFVVAEVI